MEPEIGLRTSMCAGVGVGRVHFSPEGKRDLNYILAVGAVCGNPTERDTILFDNNSSKFLKGGNSN